MPGKSQAHYRGTYWATARRIRLAAAADPATRCWRCGRTAAEHRRPWHAGHIHDGQIGGPLAPECERCNTSAGARLGNARRRRLRTSRTW
jgi:hypothetical protein